MIGLVEIRALPEGIGPYHKDQAGGQILLGCERYVIYRILELRILLLQSRCKYQY